MDITNEIAFEFGPRLFRIYKDGRIDRFDGTETVPPSTDPLTGVQSKDIIISPEAGLSARLFLPRIPDRTHKLPVLIYIHGGAFCIHTPFSQIYHCHVAELAAKSEAVAVSVHYRRSPEHPLPIAFEDAWSAVEWVAGGSDRWLNDHADLGRVFVTGDSAGATLGHYVVSRAGSGGLNGFKIVGFAAIHPFFDGAGPDKLLEIIFPTRDLAGDPRVDPRRDPGLGRLGCERLLVCVAEKDFLRERGLAYHEAVKESGWGGTLELFESKEEGHVFHLLNPNCYNAVAFVNKLVSFLKSE